jgi:hypothetical protein
VGVNVLEGDRIGPGHVLAPYHRLYKSEGYEALLELCGKSMDFMEALLKKMLEDVARRRNGGTDWAGYPPSGPDQNISLSLRPPDDDLWILTRLD